MVVAEVVPPIPAIQEAVEGEVNPKVSSWECRGWQALLYSFSGPLIFVFPAGCND